MLGKALEILGVAQQDFGQKLATGKERDQRLDGARVVGQEAEQRRAVGDALRQALEVDQDGVGVGRVGQREQQVRQEVRPVAGQPPQAVVGGPPIGEAHP